MELQNKVARALLEIEAVQIKTDGYFTWTSGIQSPIYCDNRLTMSYPEIRTQIAKAFAEKLVELNMTPDVIAGCATAGIPHAAWLADELNVPMAYVRSKPKGHGKGNQIEGKVEIGQKVLVIEDLISTGGSSIDAANVLREEGADVLGVFAIFTYGLQKAVDRFKQEDLFMDTITNFDHLLDVLREDGKINSEDTSRLLKWRDQL
ncbi:MAG TPA: orotate phosphoribosyltransferase [Candidatus Pseudogracilibacillus intestinigallinarum]|uniref:Orotate phosphoribosyltransferase n=1 Tax=Candidatus Pseudogracilibacillus intestinigallinarum TaxID=2838742 RepID=A0A9D1TIZ5_9BACI|nr:orotate phosphoribosyltransferase [Candidatus Pseudogracilibacillus intestinigallinarum]